MQPHHQISKTLSQLADKEHYLFALKDFQAIVPNYSLHHLKSVICRMERRGLLKRVCRSLYIYEQVDYPRDLVLYHVAGRLRANKFNYLSLESVLSDAGVISQVPMNSIAVISSGRSNVVKCGEFGHIDFIHTKRPPQQSMKELTYDARLHLWRASVKLALYDMKVMHRNKDLINEEVVDELI